MTHVPAVRRQSIRVALAATGVVAIAYLVIAVAVVMIARSDLTSQGDQRLMSTFDRVPPDLDLSGTGPGDGHGDPSVDPGRDPGRPYGVPLLVWVVAGDGAVTAATGTPDLPAELAGVVGPTTATIDGTEMRIAGRATTDGRRIVAAQSTEVVADVQRTILFGTLLIAPFLLVVVFAGAFVVGNRVAAPIEAARRRQLDFTADASHELRTPLSVIEAHTSLALAADRDAAWYRTAFIRVDRESKRMRRLLEDMLWLARFDAAGATPETGAVDLGVLARHAADRFAAVAETRHLSLVVRAPEDGVVIAAPADLVDRLIGVLVDNACKYAPEGGSVAVTVGIEAGRAFVTVDDSGPGLPDEDRDRIFDRFHRAVSTAGEASGAGLGLAIGDAIVKATGGRWVVGTSPAGGARFTVSWSRTALD